jgi:hypothetical protein
MTTRKISDAGESQSPQASDRLLSQRGNDNPVTTWQLVYNWIKGLLDTAYASVFLKVDQTTQQTIVGAPKTNALDFVLDSDIASAVGRLKWSESEKGLEFGVEGGTIDVNKEIFDYYVDSSTGGLAEGNIVSVVGITGNRQAVDLTDCTDRDSAIACVGMVTYTNDEVRVTKKGRVRGLNTTGLTEGLPVYVDEANPGQYLQTLPTAPNYLIHVGVVEVAGNNGIIDVDIRIYLNLGDLSNMDISNEQPSQLIKRDATNTKWENWTPDSFSTMNYLYIAADPNLDTAGDWRQFGDDDGFYIQYCTVGDSTKGSGTWVTKFTTEV